MIQLVMTSKVSLCQGTTAKTYEVWQGKRRLGHITRCVGKKDRFWGWDASGRTGECRKRREALKRLVEARSELDNE